MSLFRSEVLAERRSERWGAAIASRAPRLVLASIALVLVGLLGMAAVLGLDYARKIRVAGYLEPKGGIAEVAASQGGRVAAVKVSERDRVARGQVLAVLDHDHYSEQGRQVHVEEAAYLRASMQRLERRMRTAEDKRASDLDAVREELSHLALERDALAEELALAEQREALRQAAEGRALKLLADGLLATAAYDQERQATLTLAQALSQLRRALAGNQRQSAQGRQALVRLEREHQTRRLQLQQERAGPSPAIGPPWGATANRGGRAQGRRCHLRAIRGGRPGAGRAGAHDLGACRCRHAAGPTGRCRRSRRHRARRRSALQGAQRATAAQPHRRGGGSRSQPSAAKALPRCAAGWRWRGRCSGPGPEVLRHPEGLAVKGGLRVEAFVVTESQRLWRWLLEPLATAVEGL